MNYLLFAAAFAIAGLVMMAGATMFQEPSQPQECSRALCPLLFEPPVSTHGIKTITWEELAAKHPKNQQLQMIVASRAGKITGPTYRSTPDGKTVIIADGAE